MLAVFSLIYLVRAGMAFLDGHGITAVRELAVFGLFAGTHLLCVLLPWLSESEGRGEEESKRIAPDIGIREPPLSSEPMRGAQDGETVPLVAMSIREIAYERPDPPAPPSQPNQR